MLGCGSVRKDNVARGKGERKTNTLSAAQGRATMPTAGARPLRRARPMTERSEPRDPMIAGGLALLAILSVLAMLLYRSAPATVEEARTRAWSSVQPEAFAPQISHARERLDAARVAAEAGSDSAALAAYDEAIQVGGTAWELAGADDQTAAATAVWAAATLESAEVLLRIGTGAALRADDNELLREALRRVEEVIASPVVAAVQERAVELRTRIERQLRPGPLEWLPPWRR